MTNTSESMFCSCPG